MREGGKEGGGDYLSIGFVVEPLALLHAPVFRSKSALKRKKIETTQQTKTGDEGL